ncbi:hypothetical protein [Ornithinimicrobium avium]|uniref:hypothetical protein n=1 Tax=Ornithinimicrobium avium TaxID=2283195 RepID=UPI0013B45CDF|nr:hypothetical protein [Ornithinimicrobium avium]
MDIHEEEAGVRTQMRLTGLVLISALLGACGGGGAPDAAQGQRTSSPDGTPAASSSSEASGDGAVGSAEGSDPAAGPVAGSNAPPGFVELRGEGDDAHAAMTDGDGSAEALLLTDPPVGEAWQVVEADGPKFVQTVCGVQLDPVQPRDAAHRRWGWVEGFTYLTSEVHTFAEAEGQGVAAKTAAALEDCDGYGLDGEGREVASGQGVHQVEVDRLGELPEGWVGWTETTVGAGLVRHNALRDVDDGWHWVSVVSHAGPDPDVEVLRDAVDSAG